ncbi:MAG TPA: serine/threonine-protein kinase [Coleofasciculaceae cyanobacterium]
MSYCLNPNCQNSQNLAGTLLCQSCGSKLLLREHYRALKPIGQGGFGRTFLAVDEDKPSKPRCVIKQFFPQTQGTDNTQKAAELFEQEAVRLDNLGRHPQIPNLLAYFIQDGQQYLVQEFIDGQNLAQALAESGVFSETQICDLLNSLLAALEFIHSHNVIHRDIKPENIIRRCDGQLVLVDFGAAKYATGTALARTGTVIGSAGYVSPEQSVGRAVFASDIYSLGLTCIHLLTQVEPFDLYSDSEGDWVWRSYLNSPVSDELGQILDKMLFSATKRRYQTAGEVLKDLNRELNQATPVVSQYSLAAIARPAAADVIMSASKQSTQNWRCVLTLTSHPKWVYPWAYSVAISPDGQTLASGTRDNTIKLWQLSTGRELRTLKGHSGWWSVGVFSVAISPDGQTLASGSTDKTIKLWQVSTGQELRTLKGHNRALSSVPFSPDGHKRVGGGVMQTQSAVSSVAFSPDGQTLASGSTDKTIKLWQVSTAGELRTLKGHTAPVTSVAFSPYGQALASGSTDKTIKLWQVSTGQEICTLTGHTAPVTSVAFSPDGQTIASGSSNQVSGKPDGVIKVWQVSTRQEISTLTANDSFCVISVAFSPDGQTIASGNADKTIKIWQLSTGRELGTLRGHTKEVVSVAFSRDGQTLASGSVDKTIKIWRRD